MFWKGSFALINESWNTHHLKCVPIVVDCRWSNTCVNWKIGAFNFKAISQNLLIILRLNCTGTCRNVSCKSWYMWYSCQLYDIWFVRYQSYVYFWGHPVMHCIFYGYVISIYFLKVKSLCRNFDILFNVFYNIGTVI